MKTMAERSQKDSCDHRSSKSHWREKANRQRGEQHQAYQNQANKELVRRVIAKVSVL